MQNIPQISVHFPAYRKFNKVGSELSLFLKNIFLKDHHDTDIEQYNEHCDQIM